MINEQQARQLGMRLRQIADRITVDRYCDARGIFDGEAMERDINAALLEAGYRELVDGEKGK